MRIDIAMREIDRAARQGIAAQQRLDAVGRLADLLAGGGDLPKGAGVRILDLGTGANFIYPLLGHAEYGWSFVGTDIDGKALDHAEALADPPKPETMLRRLRSFTSSTRFHLISFRLSQVLRVW